MAKISRTYKMDPDILDPLKRRAEIEDRSVAYLINKAVRHYLGLVERKKTEQVRNNSKRESGE